jgi:H+/gluconate symporter-like permease
MTISLFSIFLGLALLMFLAYRGHSIIWVAPLCAAVVAFLSGMNVLETYISFGRDAAGSYAGSYMRGTAEYFVQWFPAFFLGAVYGKLMDMTGSARSLADVIVKLVGPRNAVLAVVLPCMLMTYGGISLFVVVFAVYPMGYAIYRAANLPRTMLPAAIAFGGFGITMTTVPGTSQIQNLIPMSFYNTTPTAAVAYSIVGALCMAIPGYFYLEWEVKKARRDGRVFVQDPEFKETAKNEALPKWHWLSGLLPILTVITVLNVFSRHIVVSLICGILLCCILNIKQWKILAPAISLGANGSLTAIMNTSCAVGFGSVIRLVPGFIVLTELMMNMPGNILFSQSVAVNVLSGATGSASGGMSIALDALGAQYVEKAIALSNGSALRADEIFQLLHRVAAQSSGGLDTLPHNGAILTLLAVSRCTHKESYKSIFIVNVLIPTFVSIVLAFIWGLAI